MSEASDGAPEPGPFPLTRHSIVHGLRAGRGEGYGLAFDRLVAGYWRPVYKHLRLKWQSGEAEAEDLTQAFFADLYERNALASYDPERARFRTFLRVCLDRFASNQRKAARRLKRGGGAPHLSLDFESAEGELREIPLAEPDDADAFFHEEWVRSLFALALQALRADCEGETRQRQLRVFERYDLHGDDADRPTYAELASELGVPATKVTNDLHAVRKRFRAHLLRTLGDLCGSEEEARDEARALLGMDRP